MKYQLIAAGAALAPLAAAGNLNRRDWGLKNNNGVEYVTEVEVVTVYDTVTVFGQAPAASSAVLPVPASSAVAATQPSEPVDQPSTAAAAQVSSSVHSAVASSTAAVTLASVSTVPAAISHGVTSSSEAAVSTSALVANTLVASSKPVKVHTQAQSSGALALKATSASTVASSSGSTSVASAAAKPQSTSTPSSSSSGKNITTSSLSPRGKKAGLSGYVGIQQLDAFKKLSSYISWYSDYTANTPSVGEVVGVGMLWAAQGSGCGAEVTNRVNSFDSLVTKTTPEVMFGFYEPDCYCPDSSAMTTSQGQAAWNSMIAPLKAKGTVLGSPSMCKQRDETWLTPFKSNIDVDWDVTSVHINKPNITGVKQDIEYYAATYGKKIWVSEFACVDDHDTWKPCTDQAQINQFIKDCVEFFQNNDTVVAYGPSNGNGLGDVWPLTTVSGALSESGTTYLNAIKGL